DEARRKFAPAEEQSLEEEARSTRCVEVGLGEEQHGIAPLFGVLDLADALALEAALATGAQALKDLGSDAPLNVRRSWALGDLARAASGHGTLFPVGTGARSAHPKQVGTWVPAGAVGEDPDFCAERPFWN